MKMNLRKSCSVLMMTVIMLVFVQVKYAQAMATYFYEGSSYMYSSGSYSNSNARISGYFSLANPLDPNLNNQSLSPSSIDYSFTDQYQTMTDESPGIYEWFRISTDASGMISQWFLSFTTKTSGGCDPNGRCIITEKTATSDNDRSLNAGVGGGSINYEANASSRWTSSAPSAVPEPATLVLFSAGLAGAFIKRRF